MKKVCIYQGQEPLLQPLLAELKQREIPYSIKKAMTLRGLMDWNPNPLTGGSQFQGGGQSDYAGNPDDIQLIVRESDAETVRPLLNALVLDKAGRYR